MVTFKRGRTKNDPCTVELKIEPDGGYSDEAPFSLTIKASTEDLKRLKDMAEDDPGGLGLAIAAAMRNSDIVQALYPPDIEPSTGEIKKNARWLYAILQELRDRGIPFTDWPEEIQGAFQILLSKGFGRDQIDPVKDPENFTFCIMQEAYYDYARTVGLTVFEEDETSSSFSNRYLFDKSRATPAKIRAAFLKSKSPTEIVRLARLKSLFSRLR